MDAKDIRNLQEAYMEVYAPIEELYKGKHGQTETEYQDSRSNAGKMVSGDSKGSGASYSSRGVQNTGPNPAGGSQKPQGQGRMTSGQRAEMQYRKANLLKKEEVEQADEEKKPLPVDKMVGQMFAHRVKSNSTKDGAKSIRYHTRANRIDDTLSGKRKPQVSRGKYAQQEKEKNRFSNRLTRSDRQGITDSYDYYDIILSHLLDEGYATSVEAAEVMMVHMSEDWRDSIVEGFPKVPVSPDRLNPIDPKTGKSKYKMVKGPDGKPKEIENPHWGKT